MYTDPQGLSDGPVWWNPFTWGRPTPVRPPVNGSFGPGPGTINNPRGIKPNSFYNPQVRAGFSPYHGVGGENRVPPPRTSFGPGPGEINPRGPRPGGGSFGGGRSSGSGGGVAVPGIIGEGAGAFAQLLGPVAKRVTSVRRAYDMVDDESPGADPPQQDTYYPGRPRSR